MNIRIESLSVNGLGPISSIKWSFKDINLIYGKNEKGKTYVVEFLLSSLFKGVKNTRPLTDSGQVIVSGLGGVSPVFKPNSKNKLEDYLFSGDIKPVDLSRLCVVKGGELSFLTHEEEPITKKKLKDYLSDQRILDVIEKEISAAIKTSNWEKGNIIEGRQDKETKEKNKYIQNLKQVDDLLKKIDEDFNIGEIKKSKNELNILEKLIAEQELARKAYAYKVWQEKNAKEKEISKIPAEDLDMVRDLITKIENRTDQIKKNEKEISDLEPKYEHYEWLKKAKDECDKHPEAFAGNWVWVFFIMAVSSTLAAVVCAFLNLPLYTLGTGLLAIISIILMILQFRSRLLSSAVRAEVKSIFQEYEEKFGSRVLSVASLKQKWDELSQSIGKLTHLKEQVEEMKIQLQIDNKDLKAKLDILIGKKVNLKETAKLLEKLQKKHKQLEEDINQLDKELAVLGVEEEDFVKEQVDLVYSARKLDTHTRKKQALLEHLNGQKTTLENLKKEVTYVTHDPFSLEWEVLIEHLRDRRDEIIQDIKDLKAQIGSGIIVYRVIEEIREREDENISRALASKKISEPIRILTQSYDGIDIVDDEIIVYNSINRFPLNLLSTGAQEQVLLALRIGIASHIFKDQKMFLVLDDAFQHSDWERREWLVDEMATLAKIGWQIVYFSMDDHIKSLFEDRLRPIFKDRYQTFELNS